MQIQKDEIRSAILSAAADAFCARGFRATLMKDIAGAARVTAGNIYSYFDSKDGLLTAVLESTMASLDAFIDSMKGATLDRDLMLAIADGICDIYQANRQAFLILFDGPDDSVSASHKERLVTWISVRLYEDYLPLFAVPDGTGRHIADALAVAVVDGLVRIMAECGSQDKTLRQTVYAFLKLMFFSQDMALGQQHGSENVTPKNTKDGAIDAPRKG